MSWGDNFLCCLQSFRDSALSVVCLIFCSSNASVCCSAWSLGPYLLLMFWGTFSLFWFIGWVHCYISAGQSILFDLLCYWFCGVTNPQHISVLFDVLLDCFEWYFSMNMSECESNPLSDLAIRSHLWLLTDASVWSLDVIFALFDLSRSDSTFCGEPMLIRSSLEWLWNLCVYFSSICLRIETLILIFIWTFPWFSI